jgi:hypothetical protein
MQNPNQKITRQISPRWDRLMRLAARIGRGEINVITIVDGEPHFVEQATKKIKLDSEEDFKENLETIIL